MTGGKVESVVGSRFRWLDDKTHGDKRPLVVNRYFTLFWNHGFKTGVEA
jgi:hypothetical protein